MITPLGVSLLGGIAVLVLFAAWMLAASRVPRSQRRREGGWRP